MYHLNFLNLFTYWIWGLLILFTFNFVNINPFPLFFLEFLFDIVWIPNSLLQFGKVNNKYFYLKYFLIFLTHTLPFLLLPIDFKNKTIMYLGLYFIIYLLYVIINNLDLLDIYKEIFNPTLFSEDIKESDSWKTIIDEFINKRFNGNSVLFITLLIIVIIVNIKLFIDNKDNILSKFINLN